MYSAARVQTWSEAFVVRGFQGEQRRFLAALVAHVYGHFANFYSFVYVVLQNEM